MTFTDLHYFVVVAEEMSISKAAKRLFITPQALSKQIKKLEADVGAELFIRAPALQLSQAGRCIYQSALKIIAIQEETRKEIRNIQRIKNPTLSIAAAPTRGKVIFSTILPIFQKEFPSVTINLVESTYRYLPKLLEEKKVDFIIGALPFSVDNIKYVEFAQDNLMLLIPKKYIADFFPADFENRKQVFNQQKDFDALAKCDFLRVKGVNNTNSTVDSYLNSHGVSPNQIIASRNVDTLISLCYEGTGAMFLPKMIYKKNSALYDKRKFYSHVFVHDMTGQLPPLRLAIGYEENRELLDYEKVLIEILQQTYS